MCYFSVGFAKAPEDLSCTFKVSTPIWESVQVDNIFKDYVTIVQGRETLADLNLLDMVDFDVIASMDRLSSVTLQLIVMKK